MEPQMALLWEVSLVEFVVVTLVLAGALAYMIGRSTALTWNGWGLLAFYTLLLTLAARFIHYSLFDGSFFLPAGTFGTAFYYAVIDYVCLFAIAAFGRLLTRNRQMSRQYGVIEGKRA